MTISLASLTSGGGSGLYRTVSFSSGLISAGASGTVLSDTATGSQYLRVTLLCTNTTSTEMGMTLTVNGVPLFSGENLIDTTPSATADSTDFGVAGNAGTDTAAWNTARVFPSLYCNSFSLVKDAGTTLNGIYYAYEVIEEI